MTILRNGSFVISPKEKLYNNHKYNGNDNSISLSRNYTTDFECKYKMHYYPFDVQHCRMEFILGVCIMYDKFGTPHVLGVWV